jgi:serine/threonine protein kinase
MSGLQKGQILNERFSLISLRGEGGMGQLWRARDLELDVDVALKVLRSHLTTNLHLVELLKNECRNTRKLIHPHIVRIFDFHRSDHLIFISMEYIDGLNFDEYRLGKGALPYSEVIPLLISLIDALSYAHGYGLVHRDIKTSNVLIDSQNSVRLADFGIASVIHSEPQGLTVTTGGSLFCMSPQQLDGLYPHPSDDIYALGVLLYDLLTGHPPFYPSITHEKIYHEVPVSVNEQLERTQAGILVSKPLEDLIMTMLAKTPEERPLTMLEVRDALYDMFEDILYQTLPPSGSAPLREQPRSIPDSRREVSVIPELTVPPGRFFRREQTTPKGQNFIKTALLIIALIGTIGGGIILIDYLKKNPLKTISQTETAIKSDEPKITSPLQQKDTRKDIKKSPSSSKELEKQKKNETETAPIPQEPAAEKKKPQPPVVEEVKKIITREDKQVISDQKVEKEPEPIPKYKEVIKPVKKIDPIKNLISSGKKNERRGKLELARADYEKALEINPESQQAQSGLSRIQNLFTQKELKKLLSAGHKALSRKNYEEARKEFLKARDLQPDSREVKEGLLQVEGEIRRVRIDELKDKARVQENAEDWIKAHESYEALLKVDGTLDFAIKGKKRTTTLAKLSKNVDYYLSQPSLLQSERHLNYAGLLIKEARKIELRGRKLPEQIDKLEALVKNARTPVTVMFQSDNLTNVAVYKVGRLGRFDTRQLELRPGKYTVVGSRDGYKDVRKEIVIKSGQIPPIVVVKCQEKI